jgi:TP901 family phage tail tape measure protein
MADLKKTVEIIFGGKDEVSRVVDNIGKKFGALDDFAKKTVDPLSNVAGSVAKADAALAAMAIGGLAYAYKKSVDFETAFVELRKVVGDSPAELDMAKKAALAMSSQYGESSTDILRSTANFVQAGFDVSDAVRLTKNALDLKIAGDVSAAESSQYLISTLKGFKASATEAARITDILNEVSNKYATDVKQLAIGMGDLSPIAKIMGFSFEETAGILTPVIEVFGSGSEAAQGLKTGLLKLIDDAKPVKDALASIGVSQKDANGQLRSGKDILYDVMKAFQGMAEPQKLFVAQQLVGIEQSARMVEVFNGMNKTMEVTKTAMQSVGSAQQEVDARLASSEVTINRLRTGFVNLAVAIGDKFRSSITGAIGGGVELEAALNKIIDSGALDLLFKQIDGLADRTGTELRNLAKTLPETFKMVDFGPFLQALERVGDAIAEVFSVDTTNPEDLAAVVQRVVDSMGSLIDVTRGLGEIFVPIVRGAVAAVEAFNSLDDSTKSLVGNVLGAAAAYKILGPAVGTILFALGSDSETMSKTVNMAFLAIENGTNAIKVAILSLAYAFASASKSAAELLDYIPGYDASEGIQRTTERVEVLGKLLEDAKDNLALSSLKLVETWNTAGGKTEEAKSHAQEYSKALSGIPAKLGTELSVDASKVGAGVAAAKDALGQIQPQKNIDVIIQSDRKSIQTAKGEITAEFPDGSTRTVSANVELNEASVAKTKKTIESKVPKEIEIQAKLDETKIKAQAETVQKAVEWEAKLNIAKVEAATQKMQAMFKSIDNTVSSTGTTISSIIGDYAQILSRGASGNYFIEQQIKDENTRRNDALTMQKDLTKAQVDLLKQRTDNLKQGKPETLQVEAAGLQPHLEAIMWEILAAIQIRANAEGTQLLVGV